MKQQNPQPNKKKRPWEIDAKWALSIQPFAIKQFYNKLWPNAEIVELDKNKENELATVLDIGGADKMIRFPDGGLSFLGQRFRRWEERKFDDFTLRRDRPSGMMTEFQKIVLSLERGGFLAGYYAYGHVNEGENGFTRMRILKFREFIEAVLRNELRLRVGFNLNGSSTFFKIPFQAIPAQFFLVNYAEDKPQQKLPPSGNKEGFNYIQQPDGTWRRSNLRDEPSPGDLLVIEVKPGLVTPWACIQILRYCGAMTEV